MTSEERNAVLDEAADAVRNMEIRVADATTRLIWALARDYAVDEIRALQESSTVEEAWARVSHRDRLAIVADTFRAIVAHAREGGSFRHLIYGRLGFGYEAYSELYASGGMDISNYFVLGDPEIFTDGNCDDDDDNADGAG